MLEQFKSYNKLHFYWSLRYFTTFWAIKYHDTHTIYLNQSRWRDWFLNAIGWHGKDFECYKDSMQNHDSQRNAEIKVKQDARNAIIKAEEDARNVMTKAEEDARNVMTKAEEDARKKMLVLGQKLLPEQTMFCTNILTLKQCLYNEMLELYDMSEPSELFKLFKLFKLFNRKIIKTRLLKKNKDQVGTITELSKNLKKQLNESNLKNIFEMISQIIKLYCQEMFRLNEQKLNSMQEEKLETLHLIQEEELETLHLIQEEKLETLHLIQEEELETLHLMRQKEMSEALHLIQEEMSEALHLIQEEMSEALHLIQEEMSKALHLIQEEKLKKAQMFGLNLLIKLTELYEDQLIDYKKEIEQLEIAIQTIDKQIDFIPRQQCLFFDLLEIYQVQYFEYCREVSDFLLKEFCVRSITPVTSADPPLAIAPAPPVVEAELQVVHDDVSTEITAMTEHFRQHASINKEEKLKYLKENLEALTSCFAKEINAFNKNVTNLDSLEKYLETQDEFRKIILDKTNEIFKEVSDWIPLIVEIIVANNEKLLKMFIINFLQDIEKTTNLESLAVATAKYVAPFEYLLTSVNLATITAIKIALNPFIITEGVTSTNFVVQVNDWIKDRASKGSRHKTMIILTKIEETIKNLMEKTVFAISQQQQQTLIKQIITNITEWSAILNALFNSTDAINDLKALLNNDYKNYYLKQFCAIIKNLKDEEITLAIQSIRKAKDLLQITFDAKKQELTINSSQSIFDFLNIILKYQKKDLLTPFIETLPNEMKEIIKKKTISCEELKTLSKYWQFNYMFYIFTNNKEEIFVYNKLREKKDSIAILQNC